MPGFPRHVGTQTEQERSMNGLLFLMTTLRADAAVEPEAWKSNACGASVHAQSPARQPHAMRCRKDDARCSRLGKKRS
jgi:hypothetical protein